MSVVYHSTTITAINPVSRAGQAIKEGRPLQGLPSIINHLLREPPREGVAEKGVAPDIIYILIYDTSTPVNFELHPKNMLKPQHFVTLIVALEA
jgi:hypothetical protein